MGFCKTSVASPPITVGQTPRKKHIRRCSEIEDDLIKYAPKKKRVRFSSDSSGSVTKSERASDIVHADLDKSKLWWTRQERADILLECQDAVKEFRTDHMDQVRNYIGIFNRCSDSLTPSSSDYIEKATIELSADVRGLEWGFAPSTKNHRREHVKDVLEVQERVKALSSVMRDRILSSRSLRSSRQGLLMARLLGEGDKVPRTDETQRKRRNNRSMSSRL